MILADIDKSITCELIKQLLAVDFFYSLQSQYSICIQRCRIENNPISTLSPYSFPNSDLGKQYPPKLNFEIPHVFIMDNVSILYKYNLYRMLRYEMQFRNEGEMFSLSQIPIWERK
jgi:hypothetical protein